MLLIVTTNLEGETPAGEGLKGPDASEGQVSSHVKWGRTLQNFEQCFPVTGRS